MRKSFIRSLTTQGGKLEKNIWKVSGAGLQIIPSRGEEETVVLSGTAVSVAKAEQMLKELQSSALKIDLSCEVREALVTGGKGCILNKIQEKLQVPLRLEGFTLVLVGKQEDTKKARLVVEEELALVKKVLATRHSGQDRN